METRTRTISLEMKEILALALCAALLAGLFSFASGERAPLSSAETRFVEMSPGGLQIVPASCPSNPHYFGQCSTNTTCEISVDPTPFSVGQSVTITWMGPTPPSGTYYSYFINTIGQVEKAWHHSTTALTDEYVLTVRNAVTNALVMQCNSTPADSDCPPGQTNINGVCVTPENPQCAATYFCQGTDLYYRNAQCAESFNQACAYGCSGGGCIAGPTGDGNITVTPALVQQGDTTTVSWTTNGMLANSCTVVENNPEISDSWTGNNDSETSSAIRQQTTYTLTCTRGGESGGTFTDNATVNIIPIFQEQ